MAHNPATYPRTRQPEVPALTRRQFVQRLGLGAAVVGLVPAAWAAEGRRKPNLLFILCDDLGWRDTTPYGSTFHETPNIQRLRERGMMFTQAYAANPLCSPTRASIQTGLWPARIGITTPACHLPEEVFEETVQTKAPPDKKALMCQSATRLKQEYYTLAEALKDAGYRTGHFGKWHLGHEPYDPLHQGFDMDVPHTPGPGPAGSYVAPWKFPEKLNFTGQPGEHIEDRMAQEAVKFLRENKDRPFYLNYWCFSVHGPWDAKQALIEKYAAKADPNSPQRNPVYAAMVKSLDDAVGTLLGTLDELKLSDNTVVIFFSDNGGVHWAPGTKGRTPQYPDVPVTSNSPLRGGKATIYEGGTREPCLVVWPSVIPPGSKSDAIIQSIDFHPTLLEVLGLQAKPGHRFDGISFVPALKSQPLSREAIFCYFPHSAGVPDSRPPACYVRKGDWKLIRLFFEKDGRTHAYELYNLKDDLSETTNLADKLPDKVKELDALIEQFLKDSNAVQPKPNPDYDPNAAALNGWRVIRNAKVSIADGHMVIQPEGGVANLMAPVAGGTGEITLEFRMRSTASGDVRAFWNRRGEGGFPPDRAVNVPFAHDGQWHDCAAKFAVTGELTAVRLDPGRGPGKIEIDWLRVKDAAGKVLREWEF